MDTFNRNLEWWQVFDNSPDPCWILRDRRILRANHAALSVFGYETPSEILQQRLSDLSPPLQPDGQISSQKAEEHYLRTLKDGVLRFEWLHQKKCGTTLPVEVTLTKMEVEGELLLHCCARDITDQVEIRSKLEESEQHFRTLANNGTALIWTSGTDKLCNYFNDPWLRFTGRTLEQEVGNGWAEGVHPDDFDLCLKTYVESFEQRQPFSMLYRIRNNEGEYRWLRDDGNPRYDTKGRFLGYIGYCMDVTLQKEYEEKIQSLAFFDTLTGLPNRRVLLDRLEQACIGSARHERHNALLFIDLDGFKAINDAHGHDQGDLLLQQAAKRLQAGVRESDTVARYGGDEFVVMLEYLDVDPDRAIGQAQTIGAKLLSELARPYQITNQDCRLTASIGMTLFSGKQHSPELILRHADALMYRSKLNGKGILSY